MMEEPGYSHKNQNAVVQPLLTGLFLLFYIDRRRLNKNCCKTLFALGKTK